LRAGSSRRPRKQIPITEATDSSLASGTLALNIRTLQWEHDLIRAAVVSPNLLAPVLPSGSLLGPIRPELAASIGLPAHVQVAGVVTIISAAQGAPV
jgi:rhamnulokinase